jgi:hypothetical protein
MQFTLGPPAPAAAPPAAPVGSLPAAPPGYPPGPGAPGYPPRAPVAPPPPRPESEFEAVGRRAIEDRDPDEPLPGHRSNKAQVFILVGVASVLMACTILVIIFAFMRRGSSVPADTVYKLKDLNIAFDKVPSGWKEDDDTRVKLGSPYRLAYKRDNPEAYMAFGATEPKVKGRPPRPSEMQSELRQPFPKLFDVNTVDRKPPAAASWLGEAIAAPEPYPNGFTFRAQSPDGMNWKGEAYTVSYKGIAYYWMSWCAENDFDDLKGEFANFRDKFKILDPARQWEEKHSNVSDFRGDKINYVISDAEDVWKEVTGDEFKQLKELEPDLDKRLRVSITPRRDRKARPDTAELSVYILDGAGDPLQVARKLAEDMEIARIKAANADFKPPTFREITDAPQGDPISNNVPQNAPYVRLESKVEESRDASRLIVASGLKVGDKIVVVHCWCEYRKRDVFETKFVQIAASLR